jgi:hypothetical protein
LGCRNDLTVVAVKEAWANFDSDIVEISWKREDSRWRQRYSPKIQTKESEITLGRDGTATELFTVGFPADKKGVTYAKGYAKRQGTLMLDYNVGSINGNSGGAVWTSDDYMLVSQTNHGIHSLGQRGWNNNDPENPGAWNGGPRMDLLYAKSATLQSIFPNGVNPNVSFEGYLIFDDTLP